MDGLSQLEQLEAINATQDFLLSEPVDISKYLDEDGECSRFEKPTTNEQIKQRERDRIPNKTRQNTSWAVNVYRAWAEYRNTKIETDVDEYSSVTLTFKTTSVIEADYWLTRFVLKARRGDGKPYPANSLYNIATGLLRHFKDDLKRFHLNILAKNDANFSSFRNDLDQR